VCVQSSTPMVPVGAQSINLVSELEQDSWSNQIRVKLDAAANLVLVLKLEEKRLVLIILLLIRTTLH
jgi:hypothetical protein